jgi:hypothetical protein
LLVIIFFIRGVKLKTPSPDRIIPRSEKGVQLFLGQDPNLFCSIRSFGGKRQRKNPKLEAQRGEKAAARGKQAAASSSIAK